MCENTPNQVESCGVVDAELAEQLRELIDGFETIRWVDVPGISSQTAAAFHRKLVEARSAYCSPRILTDGGRDGFDAEISDPTKQKRVLDLLDDTELWLDVETIARNLDIPGEEVQILLENLARRGHVEVGPVVYRTDRFTNEHRREIFEVAEGVIHEAQLKLIEHGGPDVDEAIILLDKAINRLVPFADAHELTDSGGYVLHIEDEGEA